MPDHHVLGGGGNRGQGRRGEQLIGYFRRAALVATRGSPKKDKKCELDGTVTKEVQNFASRILNENVFRSRKLPKIYANCAGA